MIRIQPRSGDSGDRLLPPLRGSCNFEISNHGLQPWPQVYRFRSYHKPPQNLSGCGDSLGQVIPLLGQGGVAAP